MNRLVKFAAVLFLSILILPVIAEAADQPASSSEPLIFNKKGTLPGNISADFSIVSLPEYKKEADEVLNYSFTEIKKIAEAFDNSNKSSDLSKVAQAAGTEPVKVGPETLALTEQAVNIAEWTKGIFDPVKGDGSYRDLKINKKESTLFLKKPGLQIELGDILEGYLADLFIRTANAANIQNALVQVDGVTRALGRANYGPWSIQVSGYSEKKAKHGRMITLSNYSAATVGGEVPPPTVDPRTGQSINNDIYSVTVLSKEASTSQGIANSIYILGSGDGTKLVDQLGVRAILALKDGTMKQVGKWATSK